MKKLTMLLCLILSLSACSNNNDVTKNKRRVKVDTSQTADRCLQTIFFNGCMDKVAAISNNIKVMDIDDIISKCHETSFYQAKRANNQIKPSCK